jgi:N-acetylneuraminic acid mutarotase
MNMRNIFKALVAVFLGAASICQATEGTWTRKADMPTARSGLCASVVDGTIYAIGGGPSQGVVITTVEQYDPAMDMWTSKANTLIPRCFFGASTVNEKIYVIGGFKSSGGAHLASVEEYDPVLDTWKMKANMPTARDHLATAVIGEKIYAIGGLSNNITLRAVEEYDPASDTWTKRADMPTPKMQFSCSSVDGILYVIGGGIFQQPVQSTVEAYDPVSDTWTTKAPMPTARAFFSTCVVNGKIFVIGGCRDPYNSSELSSVEMYNPATDTWTIMDDMPTKRKALATATVNGKIYAIGGQPVAGWNATLSIVEEYQLTPPPPDFNGDGIVDIKDLLKLIESWGQHDPVVDISPFLGDGVVDVLDLEFLMSYWKQPIDDLTLLAHWALDEAEGIIAKERAGGNDGYLFGDPVWQPDEGIKDGALQFDGVNDYVLTTFNLNPAQGPFSVFAWIKGGVPGQVVISQMDGISSGETWLGIDPVNGCLITELVAPPIGRFISQPLESDQIIIDDIWHHIGLVWDGSYRTLYVDGIEVAKDSSPLASLNNSDGGLYIGVNKNLDAGTYFSGLIDDVRIYNRAVSP